MKSRNAFSYCGFSSSSDDYLGGITCKLGGGCGHERAGLCTHGALIPASPSNYLNCAYRSYCAARVPSEIRPPSSCPPAALAAEISTLGGFVLRNNGGT